MTGALTPGSGASLGNAAPTVSVANLSRWYGSIVAVNGVSFDVYPGVTGLLGPNGAGKTTLLRVIAGLLKPSEGSVTVLGQAVRSDPAMWSHIGVMPEHDGVYPFLTGRQFVELNARLHNVVNMRANVDRAIDAVQLADAQHRALGTYSRGMRQRMRMAAVLVHDPRVLLLDEPLSGTDPRQRAHFLELARRLAREGRTLVISSHILEEVEAIADRILLMIGGKLAAAGDFRVIRRKLSERPFHVRVVVGDARQMAAALMEVPEVQSVAVTSPTTLRVLSMNVESLQRAVPKVAWVKGVRLVRFEPLDDSLESVFSYLAER
ncbi:MAG: ABC transporter ATP-binding protein [Chloroflexi bacterium]|nr:ABC transporter ATP-binding protein [Chloroflexota bacterium]